MKLLKTKYFLAITTFVLAMGYIVSCTKNDHVLNLPVQVNGTELFSKSTTTAPTIDGTIDAVWNDAAKLNFTVTIPDAGNGFVCRL